MLPLPFQLLTAHLAILLLVEAFYTSCVLNLTESSLAVCDYGSQHLPPFHNACVRLHTPGWCAFNCVFSIVPLLWIVLLGGTLNKCNCRGKGLGGREHS